MAKRIINTLSTDTIEYVNYDSELFTDNSLVPKKYVDERIADISESGLVDAGDGLGKSGNTIYIASVTSAMIANGTITNDDISTTADIAPSKIATDAYSRFVSDADKTSWNSKENAITAGTAAQYWRGDKTWQTLNPAAVGAAAAAHAHSGADITTGTVADARLSTNVALKDSANIFTKLQSIVSSVTSDIVLIVKNTISNAAGDLMHWVVGTTVVAKVTSNGTVDASGFKVNGRESFVNLAYMEPQFLLGINDISKPDIELISNYQNWDVNTGRYIGPPLSDALSGTEYYTEDGLYCIKMKEDNKPVRMILG
jgi:hypothetical protein